MLLSGVISVMDGAVIGGAGEKVITNTYAYVVTYTCMHFRNGFETPLASLDLLLCTYGKQ